MKKISKIVIILITIYILIISLIISCNIVEASGHMTITDIEIQEKAKKAKKEKTNKNTENNTIEYKTDDMIKFIDALQIDIYSVTDITKQTTLQGYVNSLRETNQLAINSFQSTVKIDKTTIDGLEREIQGTNIKLSIKGKEITNSSQANNLTTSTTNQSQSGATSNTGTDSGSSGNSTTTSGTSDFEDSYYIPQSIQKVNNGIYLVDARHNHDGKTGDGAGNEVFIGLRENDKKLYKVYRSTDMKLQRTMAFLAADMSNNDNIGYIYGSDTVRAYFRKHNYNPSEVVEKCDTDCSSFVSMAMEGAFAKSGKDTKIGRLTTSSMPNDLKQYGFNVVNEMGAKTISDFYKTGQLQIGDILVTVTPKHTAIFLGPYYTTGKIAPSSAGSFVSGGSNGYTAEGEEVDDRQNIDEKNFRFSGLPGDVTYEGEINPIRNFFKKIGDFIDYLLGLLFMIIKVIIIGFTNIIYNIFLTITSFMKK